MINTIIFIGDSISYQLKLQLKSSSLNLHHTIDIQLDDKALCEHDSFRNCEMYANEHLLLT